MTDTPKEPNVQSEREGNEPLLTPLSAFEGLTPEDFAPTVQSVEERREARQAIETLRATQHECERCDGLGAYDGGDGEGGPGEWETCDHCGGSGTPPEKIGRGEKVHVIDGDDVYDVYLQVGPQSENAPRYFIRLFRRQGGEQCKP